MRHPFLRASLLLVTLAAVTSCSGSDGLPTPPSSSGGGSPAPSDGHGDTGTTPPPGTITIRSTGMSPQTITVAVGTRVTFVNGDSRPHDVAGGPDPSRPECPEIDAAGFIPSGVSRQTAAFTKAGVCRYHDHTYVGVPEFTGTIVVE